MRTNRKAAARAAAALLTACALALVTGCSGSGGKESEDKADDGGGGGTAATTPRMKIAMVTHSGEGDTFWDIVQSGAKVASAKDNVQFLYAANKEGKEQAQLIQSYLDQDVDGLVVSLAKPEAVKAVLAKAAAAGVPVVTINSGAEFSEPFGALSHIGQDEAVAGEPSARNSTSAERRRRSASSTNRATSRSKPAAPVSRRLSRAPSRI